MSLTQDRISSFLVNCILQSVLYEARLPARGKNCSELPPLPRCPPTKGVSVSFEELCCLESELFFNYPILEKPWRKEWINLLIPASILLVCFPCIKGKLTFSLDWRLRELTKSFLLNPEGLAQVFGSRISRLEQGEQEKKNRKNAPKETGKRVVSGSLS